MRRIALLAGCFLVLTGCVATDTDYEVATLVLPQGNPHDGRGVFLNLGCTSCHAVSWEAELPLPVADPRGPEMTAALARQTAGGIATSILLPSHYVAPNVMAASDGSMSPMGDFTEAMTVRQLIDVVAYLRASGGDSAPRTVLDATQPHGF